MATKALYLLAKLRSRLGMNVRIPDPYGLLNEVIMDIMSRTDLMTMWRVGILKTVAEYTTGTVAVNNGETTVTGTGTTWTAAMVDRKIKLDCDTAYYTISDVTDTTHLTINTEYVDDDRTGEEYTIYQDEYSLANDFDGLVSWVKDLERNELLDSRDMLHSELVYNPESVGRPSQYALIGVDSNDNYRIRLVPYPNDVRIYEYRYRTKRTILSAWDDEIDIPPEWDDMVLAGLRAKLDNRPETIAVYESYFHRFKGDKTKNSVVRYVRQGRKADTGAIHLPTYSGRYISG